MNIVISDLVLALGDPQKYIHKITTIYIYFIDNAIQKN